MPARIALDTSFVAGLIDDKDLWHAAAYALRPVIDTADYQMFVFDCVMTEA
jgi:predicted nucleic acid-binding protein